MRDVVAYLGFWSRLALVSVVAVTAGTATAQRQPPAFKKASPDCFKHPLTLPEAQLRTIADSCGNLFATANKLPVELSNAGFHAATARNRLKEFSAAAPILERIIQETRTAAKTREDAKYQLAVAYSGQGSQLPVGPERAALLGKAIAAYDEALTSPSLARGTPLYAAAVFQRAIAYQSRGGGTLDYTSAIDGFASLAEGGPGVDAVTRDAARQNLTAVALTAGASELEPEAGDSAAAQRAAAFYTRALKFDSANLDLNIGLGDAKLVVARAAPAAEKASWFGQARTAYSDALRTDQGGPRAAAINLGLAQSSRGLGELPQAIAYYKAAASTDPSYKVVSELANAQVEFAQGLQDPAARQAAFREAEQTFETASQRAAPGQKLAMLLALANVQELQGNRRAALRATLEGVLALDRNSLPAQVKLGKSYFDEGLFDPARRSLEPAAGRSPGPGESKDVAEANYFLSRIDAERGNPGDDVLRRAIQRADAAVSMAGADARYRDQACLVRIRRGRDSVTASSNLSSCAGSDQPEGLLLRGMFFLRQAQYTTNLEFKASLRNQANLAFDDGFKKAAEGPVRDRLQYGRYVAVPYCTLATAPDAPPFEAARKQRAEAYFDQYHVRQCRADGQ
jgi:tetratricopeptide (TPR) repeat protein